MKREEPERPPCGKCGAPASAQASLAVQQLELARDAGAHTRPYWQPSYRTATRLEVFLCQACVRADFKFDLAVSGSVVATKAKRS